VGASLGAAARRRTGRGWQATLVASACALFAESHAAARPAGPEEAPPSPLELSLAYKAEGWAVPAGRAEGTRYLDNLDLGLTLDLEPLGWEGATFAASGLYNNRSQLTEALVGDFQTISNIDNDGSPRLYELWLEQRLGQGLRAKLGVIDLNSEFDVNELGGLFINSSHGIAPDFSQIGANGPSIFPAPGLGAMAEAEIRAWRVRIGLFEGIPRDPERPRRTVFGLTRGEGVLVVAEGERRWSGGRAVLGLRHHSGDFERWGAPAGTAPAQSEGSSGAYLIVENRLAGSAAVQLLGFARIGLAERRIHEVELYTGAGLVLQGPLLGFGGEQLGLALASAWSGAPYRVSLDDGGTRHETAVELTYSVPVLSWLTVQPDLQWIVNPGFRPRTGDALALGVRLTASFAWRPARAGNEGAPSGASARR
jgi:porin